MDSMTAAELQETFHISRADWRRIATSPGMIEPIDPRYAGGATKWPVYEFVRWLAAHHPALAQHTPHLLRPAGKVVSQYYGGTYAEGMSNGFRHEYFAGHWLTGYGRLAIVYPCGTAFGSGTVLDHLPQAATVVVVRHALSLHGLPGLEAVDRARPHLVYKPRWSEVAAHIGSPVPWWPSELRRKEHLTRWLPSHEPTAVEVVTWPNWEPLYDMALREGKNTPVRIACFSIGHEIRSRAVEEADHEITHMNNLEEPEGPPALTARQAAERACMVIPAFPDRNDPGQAETGSEEVIREGIAQLCQRTDDLAVECLRCIKLWTDRYMPFGGAFSVIPASATAAGREWIRRLKETSPTAIHWAWSSDRNKITGTLVDPVTGSPVVTEKGRYMFHPTDEVSFHSYAPRQLPPGSQIKEVILDEPVWVRTQDGTLYPAPVMGTPGVSWGYSGTGPRTLAILIGRLLDDGSAHALTRGYGGVSNAEPKLEEFLRLKHPRGTRLSRRLLENVRKSGLDNLGLFNRIRFSRLRGS